MSNTMSRENRLHRFYKRMEFPDGKLDIFFTLCKHSIYACKYILPEIAQVIPRRSSPYPSSPHRTPSQSDASPD